MANDKTTRDPGRLVPHHGSGPGGPAWRPPGEKPLKDQLKFSDGGFGNVDFKLGLLSAPWRLDRDDAHGITVVDKDGDVVLEEMWRDVPMNTPHRTKVIAQVRGRIRLVVSAVNHHERFIVACATLLAANEAAASGQDGPSITEAIHDLAVLTTEAMTLAAEA